MGHDIDRFMDEDYLFATVYELYCTATTTGQQQQQGLQQMPWVPPPGYRPWQLQVLQQMSQELEELHKMWELQKHLRLPPEDQQKLLRIVMELREEVEVTIEDTPPELQRMRELRRLWELWELPDELIKDLQEL